MKKHLKLLFAVSLTYYSAKAQVDFPRDTNGEVSFSEVITTKNKLSEDEIYENFKEWFSVKSTNFNRSNSEKNAQGTEVWLATTKRNFQSIDALFKNDQPLKLSDKESKKLIGKVVNKYTGGTMGCIRVLYLEYDLIVEIKDGRYRYSVTNFTYTHYNQASAKQTQIYGWKDEGECKSKGTLTELLLCDRCEKEFNKFYEYIHADVKELITDMAVSVDKVAADDNW